MAENTPINGPKFPLIESSLKKTFFLFIIKFLLFEIIKISKNFFSILLIVCSIKVFCPNFIIDLSVPILLDLPPAKITPKILFSVIKTNIKH